MAVVDQSLANRHSCSTSAEMRDRKCFSMQLILVVGKMDMINQICQMLSLKVIVSLFCWKKMITKYSAVNIPNVGIPTFVFSDVCMQVKLVNILTYVPILRYENGVTIP